MTNQEKLNSQMQVLIDWGYSFKSIDFDRPWGGFFVIDESLTEKFINQFYPHMKEDLLSSALPLSPKILCVAPHQELSWQYHHRRSELWKLIDGSAGFKKSDSDVQGELQRMKLDEVLILAKGERHRLVGLSEWGIIAEIWRHTDEGNPSDEDDIVRLQDNYGR
jgi:mannose-6-phosphate isomerase